MRTILAPLANRPILAVWMVVVALWMGPVACAEPTDGFRDILKLSGVQITSLAQIAHATEPTEADWPVLLNVFHRLKQIRHEKTLWQQATADPTPWLADSPNFLGRLAEVSGRVFACERVAVPKRSAELHEFPALFRCQFRFSESKVLGIVYTRDRPARWENRKSLDEPIRFRGVILKTIVQDESDTVLLLTNHLQWLPTRDAPSGSLLLARHGMDASLLDEVRHRRPFVKPQVSREGEAFYTCLATLGKIDLAELTQQANQSVERSAEKWQKIQTETTEQLAALQRQTAEAKGTAEKKELQQQTAAARQRAAMADLILQRAATGRSSVAPLLVQPEKETGQLVLVEGIARRVVRIVVDSKSASEIPESLEAYYEIEVFTPHSNKLRNLPVVCCVAELPDGFPQGDEIREPVRLAGMFFKSWVYTTRQPSQVSETASGRQRVFAPIVLGRRPVWLQNRPANSRNPWAIWGGVAFLLGVAILWVVLARSARHDRLSWKTTLRREALPTNPWDDMQKEGSP